MVIGIVDKIKQKIKTKEMILNDRMSMRIYDIMYKHYIDNKGDVTTSFESSATEVSDMIQHMITSLHDHLVPDMDGKEFWKENVNKI